MIWIIIFYEQYYQLDRRFYRFGQTREVTIDRVISDGQVRILQAIEAKAEKASNLFSMLNANLNKSYDVQKRAFDQTINLPSFLQKWIEKWNPKSNNKS